MMKKILIGLLFIFSINLFCQSTAHDVAKNYHYRNYTQYVGVAPSRVDAKQPLIVDAIGSYMGFLMSMYDSDSTAADSLVDRLNIIWSSNFEIADIPHFPNVVAFYQDMVDSIVSIALDSIIINTTLVTQDSLAYYYLKSEVDDSLSDIRTDLQGVITSLSNYLTIAVFNTTLTDSMADVRTNILSLTDSLASYMLSSVISDSLAYYDSTAQAYVDDTLQYYTLVSVFIDSLGDIRGDISTFISSDYVDDTLSYYWTGNRTNDSIIAKIARAGISNLDDTLAYYYLGTRVMDSIDSAIADLTYLDYYGTPAQYYIPFMYDLNTIQTNSQYLFTGATRVADAIYTGTDNPNNSTRINWNKHLWVYEITAINGLNTYFPYGGNSAGLTITMPTLNATQSSPYISMSRAQNYGSRSVYGDFIYINDYPVTAGTVGGAILRALVDGTVRTLIDPRLYYATSAYTWGTDVGVAARKHTVWMNIGDTLMHLDTTNLEIHDGVEVVIHDSTLVQYIQHHSKVDSTWGTITIQDGIILPGGDTLKDVYELNDSIMAVVNQDTMCMAGCHGTFIISTSGDTLKGADCIDVNCDSAYILVNNRTFKVGGTASGGAGSITGNESAFDGWDKDVSDDFDGDYNSLTNQPSFEDSVLLYEDDSTFLKSVAYLIDAADTTAWNAVINAIDSIYEDQTPELGGDLTIGGYDFIGNVRGTGTLTILGNTYLNTTPGDSVTAYQKLVVINGINRMILNGNGLVFGTGDTLKSLYPLNDSIMGVIGQDTVCVAGCALVYRSELADTAEAIRSSIEESIASLADSIGVVTDVDLSAGAITSINTNQSDAVPKVISVQDTIYRELVDDIFVVSYELSTTWYIKIYSTTAYDSLTVYYLKNDLDGNSTGEVDTTGTPVANQLAIFTKAYEIGGFPGLTYSGTTLTNTGTTNTASLTVTNAINANGNINALDTIGVDSIRIGNEWFESTDIGGGGEVDTSGTPTVNELAVFVTANKIGSLSYITNSWFKGNTNAVTGFGYQALNSIVDQGESANNTAIGYQSSRLLTSGAGNVSLGYRSIYTATSGGFNTAIGNNALYTINGGNENVGIGNSALYSTTNASYNVSVGDYGLYSNTTGTNNIALGFASGRYNTTLSNRLFINSLNRTNIAGDTTKSIIYGFQSAITANQKLYFNANTISNYDLTLNGKATLGNASTDSVIVTGDLVVSTNTYLNGKINLGNAISDTTIVNGWLKYESPHTNVGFTDSTATISGGDSIQLTNAGDSLFRYVELEGFTYGGGDTILTTFKGGWNVLVTASATVNTTSAWKIELAYKRSGTVYYDELRDLTLKATGAQTIVTGMQSFYFESEPGDKVWLIVTRTSGAGDFVLNQCSWNFNGYLRK